MIPPAYAETATYQWYAGGEKISGATDDELLVTGDLRDLTISVSVTDAEGNTVFSDETLPVAKDLSAEVTITDMDGLQDDGTALPTDELHLSYGAGLGTPENIIWYQDGAARAIYTARGGFGGAFNMNSQSPAAVAGSATKAKGEWYVIVQNTEGENFVSNSILVTVPDRAIMSGVTITEDYETPNIEYTKTTSTAVVTVTLNKDYAGTFYLAPDDRTTFYNKADLLNEIKTTEMTTKKLKDMTEKNAVAAFAGGKGISYLNEETEEITYMFAVKMDAANGTAVKRGSDYNLIFDQDNIDEDDLEATTGKGKLEDLDLNMTEALTVPYVVDPDSIAVTNYAAKNGAGAKIKVTLYDEEGAALTWYKDTTSDTNLPGFGNKIKVYNVSNNATSATDVAIAPADAVADKGVATLTYTGTGTQFAYVSLETTAGVFAADSVTLTTPVVETLGPALDEVKVTQDSANPKNAVIKFKNLTKRGSGTVYLFQSGLQAGATTGDDNDEDTSAVITAQNKEGAWMLGSATVEGGSSSVTLENVFDKSVIGTTAAAGAEKYNDYYAALFVPDDSEYYAELASDPFLLKHELKSYKLAGTYEKKAPGTAITGAIQGVDQFGDAFALDAITGESLDAADQATKQLTSTLTATAGGGTLAVAFTDTGNITATITGTGTGGAEADGDFVKDTYLEVTLPGGQKLVATCDTTSDVTGGNNATFKFAIK